jgi:hypothetical protein
MATGLSLPCVEGLSKPLLSRKVKYLSHLAKHKGRGIAGRGETLKEERLSYLRSFQGHAAMEYGELRSVMALKAGVGDHTPERFADHEPDRNANHGFAFGPRAIDWKRLSGLTH